MRRWSEETLLVEPQGVMYKGEPTGRAATDTARVILERAECVSNLR